MKNLPDSTVDVGGSGGSWFFFGAEDVILFVGTMILSVLTLGILPAVKIHQYRKLCQKK